MSPEQFLKLEPCKLYYNPSSTAKVHGQETSTAIFTNRQGRELQLRNGKEEKHYLDNKCCASWLWVGPTLLVYL